MRGDSRYRGCKGESAMTEFEREDSELMKAAGMIKAYCANHCCVVCPFFDEGEEVCKINTEPCKWEELKNE